MEKSTALYDKKYKEVRIIANEKNTIEVPIWERFLLTVKEASLYFNIGENKLHRLVNDYMDSEYKFVIQNGGRAMIKREKFEKFLNDTTTV